MNNTTKEIIDNIFDELVALQESIKKDATDTSNADNTAVPQKVELLTIKECADMIDGLSEHTVRQMVKQGKVKSIRTGVGKNGKILINKADFITYFNAMGK